MAILKNIGSAVNMPYSTTTWYEVASITGRGYIKSVLGFYTQNPANAAYAIYKVRITIDGVATVYDDNGAGILFAKPAISWQSYIFLDIEFKVSLKIEIINDIYYSGSMYVITSVPVVLE